MQSLTVCLALAARRLTSSEPFTLRRTVKMPWCFAVVLAGDGGDVSKLEEEQISKTTMTFTVQLLVFSHCTKNAYNIVRDFQRMLLTNFSFRHELLSRVFISFAFFTLFLPSCEHSSSTLLGKNTKLLQLWELLHVAPCPLVWCFTMGSLEMPLHCTFISQNNISKQRNRPSLLQTWSKLFQIACSPHSYGPES